MNDDFSLYLKILANQIEIYKNQINVLEFSKPMFFQKKKLKDYLLKKEYYEQKIFETYLKMNDEVNYMLDLESKMKG